MTASELPTETVQTVVCAGPQHHSCSSHACGVPNAGLGPLSPTSAKFAQAYNRGFGPPPPIPPRSTRPDYVRDSGQRSVGRDTEAIPLTVVEVSDSDSDELSKDLEKVFLTAVDVSDCDSSDDPAESVLVPVAQSTAVTNAGVSRLPSAPPNALPPTRTTESRPITSYSAQTPRNRKRVYVVTKGRRTGVFDSWLYVDSLVKGIDSTYKSYKDKDEAIEDFLKLKGMGLVKQSGTYRPDLFPNAPEDLSAEY